MITCAEIEEFILNRSQQQLVEAHVRGCEDCRQFLEAFVGWAAMVLVAVGLVRELLATY